VLLQKMITLITASIKPTVARLTNELSVGRVSNMSDFYSLLSDALADEQEAQLELDEYNNNEFI